MDRSAIAAGDGAVVLRFPTRPWHRRRAAARRARAVAVVIAVAAVLVAGSLGEPGVAGRRAGPRFVTVQAGDTLWGIAEEHVPAGVDVRAYVDAIEVLNDLDAAPVAGMRLRLPR